MYVLYVAVFRTYTFKALKNKALSAVVRFVRCSDTPPFLEHIKIYCMASVLARVKGIKNNVHNVQNVHDRLQTIEK